MGSLGGEKPHLVCIPYPAQGHVTPMLTLAKLLHFRGFHITFVNTEFNHHRLVVSQSPDCVKGFDDFQFETIPDGLSTTNYNRTQDIPALCDSIKKTCQPHFVALFKKLNSSPNCPTVTSIITDGAMSVTIPAAEELGIPAYIFYTPSACGLIGYLHYRELIERGYVPLKDESCLTNGYLNTQIDWIPGMKGIRLRDLPTFIRTTDINDIMLNYDLMNIENAKRAKGIILNTFDDLEREVLEAIKDKFSVRPFTIGPLSLTRRQIGDSPSKSIGTNLWKEDRACIEWLDHKAPRSVVYVNFGSITVITAEEMRELAWGVANTNYDFLWVARPDLVKGGSVLEAEDFVEKTRGRGMFVHWCPQEEVLFHSSVGCFLTHCGWNSTIESISAGVPMICWPFFAEQTTNCRFSCTWWGVGAEIDHNVSREEVTNVVKETMDGSRGEAMKMAALEWKELAGRAAGGASHDNLERLITEVVGLRTG